MLNLDGILMGDELGKVLVTDPDRKRIIRPMSILIVVLSVALGFLIYFTIQWMTSPALFSPDSSVKVELVSTGETLGTNHSYETLIAKKPDGTLVGIDAKNPEDYPEGESFQAWFLSSEDAAFNIGATPQYVSEDGYYSFEKHLPSLKSAATSFHLGLLSVGSLLLLTMMFSAFCAILFSKHAVVSPAVREWHLEYGSSPDFRAIRNKGKPFWCWGIVMVIRQLIFMGAVFLFTSPAGPDSFDLILAGIVILIELLVAAAFFRFGGIFAFNIGTFIFARFIVSDFGRIPAKALFSSRSEGRIPRLHAWLEKSDWHEETALALLPEFEGTLDELIEVSRSLGPDNFDGAKSQARSSVKV